jgi:hypothetical protein
MIGFVWLRPDVLLVFEDDLRLLKIEGDIKYIYIYIYIYIYNLLQILLVPPTAKMGEPHRISSNDPHYSRR